MVLAITRSWHSSSALILKDSKKPTLANTAKRLELCSRRATLSLDAYYLPLISSFARVLQRRRKLGAAIPIALIDAFHGRCSLYSQKFSLSFKFERILCKMLFIRVNPALPNCSVPNKVMGDRPFWVWIQNQKTYEMPLSKECE